MLRSLVTLSIITFLLSVIPAPTEAATLTLTNPWIYDQPVIIIGNNLDGDHPLYKQLCIAPEALKDSEKCYEENDDIKFSIWNDTRISFMPPADAPARGYVTLKLTNDVEKCFGSAGCDNFREYDIEKEVGTYAAQPFVTDIVDIQTGKNVFDLQPSTTYKIKGALFGEGKGSIYLNYQSASTGIISNDITSWSYDTIVFRTPADTDSPIGLSINNSATATKYALLEGHQSSSLSAPSAASNAEPSTPTTSWPTTSPFVDVSNNDDYVSAILWAKQFGILQGYPDGTFMPNNVVNRAEFLKIVLRAKNINVNATSGTSGFKDVDENDWFAPYVRYAKTQRIIQGYPDGTFKPNQAVNFAEALKMAYNALGVSTNEISGDWYERFLQHAILNDVLFTADARVDAGMSRKDVVWIVWKLITHNGDWQQPVISSAAPPTSPSSSLQFKDGTYIVGTDIQAGTYRTRRGSSNCYYERLSGFSGELNDIINNNNTDAPAIVTIDAADKGFKSSNCGTWTQDLSAITTSQTSFGDGMFIVGTDIEAGTYKNTGGQNCYYERLKGFGGTLSDIITNDNTNASTIIAIDPNDRGFESSHCGTWNQMR